MSARVSAPALLDYILIQIQAPVVIVVHVVSSTPQKGADVAAEIQNLFTLPCRMSKHIVEIAELC
jgi:hypothetical protein